MATPLGEDFGISKDVLIVTITGHAEFALAEPRQDPTWERRDTAMKGK